MKESNHENYVYPAFLGKSEDGRAEIRFIDFPGTGTYSDKSDKDGVLRDAQKLLAKIILEYKNEKKELPKPTMDVKGVVYIQVWMPRFENTEKEIYVKKTVTIPQWVNMLAKERHISFSNAMVKGIKEELGIEN